MCSWDSPGRREVKKFGAKQNIWVFMPVVKIWD